MRPSAVRIEIHKHASTVQYSMRMQRSLQLSSIFQTEGHKLLPLPGSPLVSLSDQFNSRAGL